MKPILSVVIPVYKVEKYLVRCVNSVLHQDYKDLEVILVDDGSPDRCPEICDEFASQDSRVKVIHKTNGGLSSARNAGINAAQGEYIAFLDSDDQWSDGLLSPLMKSVTSSCAQMVIFASRSLYEDGELYKRDDQGFFENEGVCYSALQIYPLLINYGDLHESACTKIIKTSFLKERNLLFKEGILGEDTEWMFRVLRSDISISVSNVPLFVCTENREGSISNTASTKSIKDIVSTIIDSLDYYKHHISEQTEKFELAHCAYMWSIALGLYRNVPYDERGDIKNEMKTLRKSLPLNSHPKSRLVFRFYRILGYELTSLLLSSYLWLHRKNVVNRKKAI